MKTKPASAPSLRQITLHTSADLEDLAAALLESITGITASSYHELRTGRSKTSVYSGFTEQESRGHLARIRAALRDLNGSGMDLSGVRVSVGKVRKEDWSESWKRHFKPFVIHRLLLVRPSWSRKKAGKGQFELTLDPGLSFGTGHHATTRFCLEQIVECRPTAGMERSCLDVGMGSGILALAAARLGYCRVRGIDFDPACLSTAVENARINGLGGSVDFVRGDVHKLPLKPRIQYDLVCANLIDDLLVSQRDRLAAQLRANGRLVLAGILTTQFEAVKKAYEQGGFVLKTAKEQGEWKSGAFVRRSAAALR